MIIYSVTITMDRDIEKQWLDYMQNRHIPDVMATGSFLDNSFQRLMEPEPEDGTVTYNIQYLCESKAILEKYRRDLAPLLQADHTARFKDKFVAFRSVLEKI